MNVFMTEDLSLALRLFGEKHAFPAERAAAAAAGHLLRLREGGSVATSALHLDILRGLKRTTLTWHSLPSQNWRRPVSSILHD